MSLPPLRPLFTHGLPESELGELAGEGWDYIQLEVVDGLSSEQAMSRDRRPSRKERCQVRRATERGWSSCHVTSDVWRSTEEVYKPPQSSPNICLTRQIDAVGHLRSWQKYFQYVYLSLEHIKDDVVPRLALGSFSLLPSLLILEFFASRKRLPQPLLSHHDSWW